MEGLSSEDCQFLREFVGKNVKIFFKANNNNVSVIIIGFGKKFIKALDGDKPILIAIDDISCIKEK